MQISDGKLYLNRTWKYLYPALRVYGFQPISYLNDLIKLGVGVHDLHYKEEDPQTPKIFILIQTKAINNKTINNKGYEERVESFFKFIRQQDYYVDDYIYDINHSCCSHMVVLEYPKEFVTVMQNFKSGKYSFMFSEKEIKKFFPNENLDKLFISSRNLNSFTISETVGDNLEIHGVLSKNENFKSYFQERLYKDFGVQVNSSDISELDYPPEPSEEVFNFK